MTKVHVEYGDGSHLLQLDEAPPDEKDLFLAMERRIRSAVESLHCPVYTDGAWITIGLSVTKNGAGWHIVNACCVKLEHMVRMAIPPPLNRAEIR